MKNEKDISPVALVGAGPGDPGLITVKGRELIRDAEVIVYDQLANPALLTLARKDAELIDAGKHAGNHTLKQDEINSLLYEKAKEGYRVVRLKGGDPYVFGRGGEEAEYLVKHGIPFETVPGVTSAAAVPAYAGIPVTHRDLTQTVTFVTGHEQGEETRIPWDHLSGLKGTLVFFMGLSNLEKIRDRLIENGMDPATKAAVISNGTRNKQRTVTGCLSDIADRVREEGIPTPALIVVGEVVSARESLRWFDKKPLFGKTVLVTRTTQTASKTEQAFINAGAEPLTIPLIRIEERKEEISKLKELLKTGLGHEWVVFTSANAVDIFMKAAYEEAKDARVFKDAKIAVIGEKTKEALSGYGINADIVPGEYRAENLADRLASEASPGEKILIPRASSGRDILTERLGEAGLKVTELMIYDTVYCKENAAAIKEALTKADYITFASSSAVEAFLEITPDTGKAKVAVIGPVTAKTARDKGLKVDVEPSEYTIGAMIKAMEREEMKS